MSKGIKLALVTAIISGLSVAANGLFVTGFNPLQFSFMRNLMVLVILSIYILASGTGKLLKKLSKKNWFELFLVGTVGGGIPFILFFTGLSMVSFCLSRSNRGAHLP